MAVECDNMAYDSYILFIKLSTSSWVCLRHMTESSDAECLKYTVLRHTLTHSLTHDSLTS